MNKFILVHTYQTLVDEDKARPLVCPDDQQELVATIDTVNDDNEDPVMWCVLCDSKYDFGTDTWDQIRAVVSEHYDI
jgi:hypothetical protein